MNHILYVPTHIQKYICLHGDILLQQHVECHSSSTLQAGLQVFMISFAYSYFQENLWSFSSIKYRWVHK